MDIEIEGWLLSSYVLWVKSRNFSLFCCKSLLQKIYMCVKYMHCGVEFGGGDWEEALVQNFFVLFFLHNVMGVCLLKDRCCGLCNCI